MLNSFKLFKSDQAGSNGILKTNVCYFVILHRQGKVHSRSVSLPVKCHNTKKKQNKHHQRAVTSHCFYLLILEKHKQQWKRGQIQYLNGRDQRKDPRNACTFQQRMERIMTLFQLCLVAFSISVTSGQDNGIYYHYWILFEGIWFKLLGYRFMTSASGYLYIL